ncbi:T9SS type A sorting domain-containing protein [Adhaeribacter aquaticus]|uniref:T9SS type A sorting domain-containing protein n=1 Tax=Adhaeribacter aquaticus TaxID=299567 RepID=UPI0006845593|nr:T9SS type A sorting domain-containing protein [Adhaeribacter aquaticus]
MKKLILILNILLLCTIGWSQSSYPVELAKEKQQVAPSTTRLSNPDILVYPNPSNGIIHLALSGFKGRKTEIRIMNVIGNVVYRETLNDVDEQFTKTIDLTRYANGLYYVKLQADDYSELRKVIIN